MECVSVRVGSEIVVRGNGKGTWRVESGRWMFQDKKGEERELGLGRTFKGHTSRFRQERPEEEGVCKTADGENEVVPPTNVFERGRAHLSDHDC